MLGNKGHQRHAGNQRPSGSIQRKGSGVSLFTNHIKTEHQIEIHHDILLHHQREQQMVVAAGGQKHQEDALSAAQLHKL